jgi:farnesyl-diphosphate farnesyltransferase
VDTARCGGAPRRVTALEKSTFRTTIAAVEATRERLLTDLLRGVSRAFYLSLRVLPKGLREPMGLAYLLARAADTISDTRLVPPAERLRHLLAFRAALEGRADVEQVRVIEQALTDKQALPAEKELLAALPPAFALLEALPKEDQQRVRQVVATLTRGMEMDLRFFPPEDSGRLAALPGAAALDEYAYFVAGCVGEFWTGITTAHARPLRHWDVERMSAVGVRFGKALQLTNILRDVPRDLRIGRCYLPSDRLAEIGLRPEDLLDPAVGDRARPLLLELIGTALDHYRCAEEYLLAVPRRCLRLRLAVLWPILIGLVTLAKLSREKAWLDPAVVVRAPQGWVYWMLAASVPAAFSNTLLRAWIAKLRRRGHDTNSA